MAVKDEDGAAVRTSEANAGPMKVQLGLAGLLGCPLSGQDVGPSLAAVSKA